MATKKNRADIVVVGSSNTDMVIASKKLPGPGETVLGGAFYRAAGGKGANQAVAAARAGARVAFVGCVGSDAFGVSTRENLAREGIDLEHLIMMDGVPSGVALILVDEEGQNLISVAPGANALLTPSVIDGARRTIENARVVLMQLEVPYPAVERAAALAAKGGATVLFNPAPAPSFPLAAPFLKTINVLVANEEETTALSRSTGPSQIIDLEGVALELLHEGVENMIVTKGREGGVVHEKDGAVWRYEGKKVKAVDAVAAGDCFCGWVAAGLAKGKSLRSSVERAARAAAVSVTRRGAQPSLPGKDEVSD